MWGVDKKFLKLLGRSATLLLLMFHCAKSDAADIQLTENMAGTNIDAVAIHGEIQHGDYTTFVGMLKPNHRALVILESSGGTIQDALSIGTEIRLRGFSTSVLQNGECYSACALIWLAGVHRLMATSSKIGFHAAYTLTDGGASENGQANAVVGSYLTRLGFAVDAIQYFTMAPPSSVQLLDFKTADALGVEVTDSGSLPTLPNLDIESTGTSFDCKKAATKDEIAVCQDGRLASKDGKLARLYGTALETATPSQAKEIKIDQRTFLSDRRACLADSSCLNRVYDARLLALSSKLAPSAGEQVTVAQPSFSCDQATEEDEKAICGNADLAAKDNVVASMFGQARGKASIADARRITFEQRQWVKARHACGQSLGCLNALYDRRLQALRSE